MTHVAFPRTPRSTVASTLRAFGTAACDLDIDFGVSRATITDAVISVCTEPPPDDSPALTLSVRIRALLRVVALDSPTIDVFVTCACGERLELLLPLPAIACDPDRVEDTVDVAGVRVRIPTGRDQQRFAILPPGPGARLAMLRELADDPALDATRADDIEAALDAADPLTGFYVTAECPACDRALRHDVDLEALAHRRLEAAQQRLVELIHRLASAYHWTEAQVLALPPARRGRYLALIERSRGAS